MTGLWTQGSKILGKSQELKKSQTQFTTPQKNSRYVRQPRFFCLLGSIRRITKNKYWYKKKGGRQGLDRVRGNYFTHHVATLAAVARRGRTNKQNGLVQKHRASTSHKNKHKGTTSLQKQAYTKTRLLDVSTHLFAWCSTSRSEKAMRSLTHFPSLFITLKNTEINGYSQG